MFVEFTTEQTPRLGASSLEQLGAHRDRGMSLHILLFLIPHTGLSSWYRMEFQRSRVGGGVAKVTLTAGDKGGLGFSSRGITGKAQQWGSVTHC